MKNCASCAKEIPDEAVFCAFCGRDQRSQPAPVPDSVIPPAFPTYQPPAAAAPPLPIPQPGMPQPYAPYQPYAAPMPPPAPPRPELGVKMSEYVMNGYRVLSASGENAMLERPGTSINTGLVVVLLFLFGIGSLIYLFVYYVWQARKAYRVQLNVLPNGSVAEIGDTLANYKRDMLAAKLKRNQVFGWIFAVVGGFFILLDILVLFTNQKTDPNFGSRLSTFLFILVLMGGPTLIPAFFMFRSAAKQKEALGIS